MKWLGCDIVFHCHAPYVVYYSNITGAVIVNSWVQIFSNVIDKHVKLELVE